MTRERIPQDPEIASLIKRIMRAFPAERYTGVITQYDPGPWDEGLDEEQALYETLKNRTWSEISPDFVRAYPNAYLLLAPQAYTAFIAAWLTYTLEHMEGEDEVREFVIYSCSPPGVCWRILSPLNPEQRATVRSLMSEFGRRESNGFIREKAIKALTRMDELIQAGKDVPWRG